METGTQIILQRMQDCPEEFVGAKAHKWDRIMRDAKDYLPTEDVEALDKGIRKINVDLFNERVLKTLSGEDEDEGLIKYKAKERFWVDPRGISGFGNAIIKAEGAEIDSFVLTTTRGEQR